MNQEVSSPVPTWCKAVIVVLLALCIVLICQAYRATSTANDIELELRSNNPNLGKNLYQFYTITRVYPTTSYATLAEHLMVLEDPDKLSALTPDERTYIADGIRAFMRDDQISRRSEYLSGIGNMALELQHLS